MVVFVCATALAAASALLGMTADAQSAGRAALVIDGNTGQDLLVQDAERPLYPASLTKMMTLYMVFDLIEQKRISYATQITITPRAASQQPSNLELPAGATLTVRQAVLALVVKSANDVACAMGENLAGSEEQFARLMTAKARQIGMKATTFRNASGLPDPGQVTTARDMATLALRLTHDFPEHYKLFATREFTFNGQTHRTHNSLLTGFEGTDGIKTGYTGASGFNLVSSVRRGQKHVIGVVFGGVTAAQRNAQMRAIVTQAFGRAKAMTRPLLVRRPVEVAEARRLDKPPVPRRVADVVELNPARNNTVATTDMAEKAETPAAALAAAWPTTPAPAAARTSASPRAEQSSASPAPSPPKLAPLNPAPLNPAPLRGTVRPPATLQAQAEQSGTEPSPKASGQMAAVPRVPMLPRPAGLGAKSPNPRSPSPRSPSPGQFHVQIGAFSTEAEARRQLGTVAAQSASLLAGHALLTTPIARANVQFFRARFAGFNEVQAQAACQSLKQQRIECVVMRAE